MTSITIPAFEWEAYQVLIFSDSNPTNVPDVTMRMTKEQYNEFTSELPIRVELRPGIVKTLHDERVFVLGDGVKIVTLKYRTLP